MSVANCAAKNVFLQKLTASADVAHFTSDSRYVTRQMVDAVRAIGKSNGKLTAYILTEDKEVYIAYDVQFLLYNSDERDEAEALALHRGEAVLPIRIDGYYEEDLQSFPLDLSFRMLRVEMFSDYLELWTPLFGATGYVLVSQTAKKELMRRIQYDGADL